MIPQKHQGGVEIDGLPGERQSFTIAANGKAFRTLIDGLYSNKIRAVTRELWSNAADSHIAAGKPTLPFKVSVPTTMDPTFRVRDFGVGLSHSDVMHLYTTIFQSSKETTNDQTGMLGLGSKSPFAYTDTFSVIAYDGPIAPDGSLGNQRTYIASIGADGVPTITHVATEPCVEARGIEVAFPVNRADVQTFAREAQWVSMGFKVKPLVDGLVLKMPNPRLSGVGWTLYPASGFDNIPSHTLIRQGVVCYPSTVQCSLGSTWMAIIDVPIGTADVTASREDLSYTQDTKQAIQNIVASVNKDMLRHVEAEVAKAKTRRAIAMAHYEFNGILANFRGSTSVSLLANPAAGRSNNFNTPFTRRPGDVVKIGSEYGKTSTKRYAARETSEVDVHLIDKARLFVDYGDKMVRKTQRIREHCRNTDFVVHAEYDTHGREVAASWVIECLELKPEQVFKVTDCPDPGPPYRDRNYVAPTKKVLLPGQYWMHRKNGCCLSMIYGPGSRQVNDQGWSNSMQVAFGHLLPTNPVCMAVTNDNVLYVTELQAERMGLPEGRRFDTALQAALIKEAQAMPIDDALAFIELNDNVSGEPFNIIRERFFAHLTGMDRQAARAIIEKARYAKIDLQNRQITATIKTQIRSLAATYPLLFGKSDRSVFEKYIQQVQTAAKAEEVATAP